MYKGISVKEAINAGIEVDRELIEASRRNAGFATISKAKLREIQKVAHEVGQYHIAAMIEDLLN